MELKERKSPKAQVALDALGIKTTCAYAGAAAFEGTKSPPRKPGYYLHVRGRNKPFQQGMGSSNPTQNARIFVRGIGASFTPCGRPLRGIADGVTSSDVGPSSIMPFPTGSSRRARGR